MAAQDLSQVIGIEVGAYPFPWTEGIFRDCLRVGYSCWVLEAGTEILGYGIMSVALNECHILNLCIKQSLQGRGCGREILRKLIALSEKRADTAFLEVRPSNIAALKLYLSEGFNEIGRRKGYYPAARGREDAIVFAKTLNTGMSFKGDHTQQ